MYTLIDDIPVWGEHDAATVEQIQRCAADKHARGAALLSDGHRGYAMPIGGVIAYKDAVSPNGVGFDISCLAAGTPVTTRDGYHLPIERVDVGHPVSCWDGHRSRLVAPNLGAVGRGVKPVLAVQLANGRSIEATADHRVLTKAGWKEVAALSPTDTIACNPFIGLPYAPQSGEVPLTLRDPRLARELAEHGLYPLRLDSPLFPIVLRLLGYVSGDGHLTLTNKRVSIYTTSEIDAADLVADFARLGFRAGVHRRQRAAHHRVSINVYVDSVALHALFGALGSPVGRKCWPMEPMPWLFGLAPWARAHFLSAFCSAEMTTPIVRETGVIPNLQVKQSGANRHAIDFIARVFRSLGFEVSVAQSGPTRGERHDAVLQLLGGCQAQLRFLEQIGFCYAHEKRVRAARAASVGWQWAATIGNRVAARVEARRLREAGAHWKDVVVGVADRFPVAPRFVYHAMFSGRGAPRCLPGTSFTADATDEICWVPVAGVDEAGTRVVFDVVTGDPAEAFYAAGVVAHNCGNKAARTDIRADDIRDNIAAIMDEVSRTVVFGIGQTSGKVADHPLFDDPTWRDLPAVGKLKQQARQQLGTVGSGNHYVDLFEDEAGWVWVGVHFGSRGLGHRICTGFLNLAGGRAFDAKAPGESLDQPATVLSLRTPLGQDYFAAMTLAGRYAYAGRDFVVGQVLDILGARATDEVHNHHNFAFVERHGGEELIVVRKGATPAFPGQRGFIGGSMGDISVIVEGVAGDEARLALYSTVHGAGRVMSRTQAAGKKKWLLNKQTGRKEPTIVAPGKVTPEMMREWLRRAGVELRGGGLDESPHVYRRLPEVLANHTASIRILHTLKPLGVAMAGADVFDPYKD